MHSEPGAALKSYGARQRSSWSGVRNARPRGLAATLTKRPLHPKPRIDGARCLELPALLDFRPFTASRRDPSTRTSAHPTEERRRCNVRRALDTSIPRMQTRAVQLAQLGDYQLLRPLAATAGNHRIFLARHQAAASSDASPGANSGPASEAADGGEPEPLVAVKLMPLGETQQLPERTKAAQFAHEIQLLRAFNHSCIPSCHTAGDLDGVRYIVLDYVEGVSLAELLGHDEHQPRALSKEVAVYLLAQVADALHHVHTFGYLDEDGKDVELGALHRDICPANIFLSKWGDVVLGDFNSASSRWLPEEYCSREAGHIAYKSPERVSGSGQASVQSDLFALATVMWEMLKGERCFRAEDDLATMDAIVRFDIAHPKHRVQGLSAKLGEVVRRNLDRDPARRYSGAYQVLQRLSQAPEASTAEDAREQLARLVQAEYQRRNPGLEPALSVRPPSVNHGPSSTDGALL